MRVVAIIAAGVLVWLLLGGADKFPVSLGAAVAASGLVWALTGRRRG